MIMDEMVTGFECLKLSAFHKLSLLNTDDIHDLTIGPNRTISPRKSSDNEAEQKSQVPSSGPANCDTVDKNFDDDDNAAPPVAQVLKGLECERQSRVKDAIKNRTEIFEQFSKSQSQQHHDQWLLQQRRFVETMKQQEQSIVQVVQQFYVNKPAHNEKIVKHYQELIQRKMNFERQLEIKKEKQKVLAEYIEQINKCQNSFSDVYQELVKMINSCVKTEEFRVSIKNNLVSMKTLTDEFDKVIGKCKSGQISESEVRSAAELVTRITTLKSSTAETISKLNAIRAKAAANVVVKAIETPSESPRTPLPALSQATTSDLDHCVSRSNFKKYQEGMKTLFQHMETYQKLANDDQLKQFRFDCKKAVNIPVNAISSTSSSHLKDKYWKLSTLLQGKTVVVGDKQVNASRHPEGIAFCTDLLAKKFVLQGDLMISSSPDAAYCYATIIVSLWTEFPLFGRLLLGYFYTVCPYVVPFYIPKSPEQTDADYYRNLGYQYIDGVIEKQDKFLKRMTGILRLYFAIMAANPKGGNGQKRINPYGINNAWSYLTAVLKLEPQMDITATILHTFLDSIGFHMEIAYGASFKKLVRIISEKVLPMLKAIQDQGGPVSRLEHLLQDYYKNGRFEKPNGILPKHFW